MKKYTVITSGMAEADIDDFYDHILYEYKQLDTAIRNRNNIENTIQKLTLLAGVIGPNEYVQAMFGINARHIIYKKMSIIFIIEENDVAYVLRVIASALIH
jgi:aromatic ring-cleaving dioxygenase